MRTCLALCFAMLIGGCAAEAADDGDDAETGAESAITGSAASAGIVAGSLEAEGLLIYLNDHSVTSDALRATGIARAFADKIVAARKNPDGTPKWFAAIGEVEKLPGAGPASFKKLMAAAQTGGYVEAAGFDPPTAAKLSVPDHLGHAPTSNDVTVEAGFDGKTPDEVVTLVRARLTNTVYAQNESFTNDTIKTTHKAFTIGLGNFYSLGSPPSNFAWTLGGAKLTLLGTMSAVTPTILMAEKAGTTTYYSRGPSGVYEAIPTPKYPIIMRARIQLRPMGERVFYPQWSAKVLTGPTSTVTESP